jgi:glutathione S-transferase
MAGVLSPSGETSMLVLRAAGTSPFVRKVRIVASVLDLDDRIEISAADTGNPEDSLRRQNPLGKIPALILENGEMIFDSAVIVDYLDWLAGGGKVIPSELKARLTQQSLADGIAEAAVLIRYERLWHEPPQRSEKWIAYQNEKIARERRRHDRARLSARLPRSRVRRGLARRSSAAGRVA